MKIEKRTIYKCTFCEREFLEENACKEHIKNERKYRKLTEEWENGKTLGELNKRYHFVKSLPRCIHQVSVRSGRIIMYYDNPILPECSIHILRWEHKRVYVEITPTKENTYIIKPMKRFIETERLLEKLEAMQKDKMI